MSETNRKIYGYISERIAVALGGTLFTQLTPIPGQIGWQLKPMTGGTLEITGMTGYLAGLGPSLFSPVNTAAGWFLPDNVVFPVQGPAKFLLSSAGATTVVQVLREMADGAYGKPSV